MKNWPVVIVSCDAFQETWLPHMQLWDKYGGGGRQVYLISESVKFPQRPDVKVLHPIASEYHGSRDWIGMLSSSLKQIDEDYFFFTLDDFFLKSPIDWARIERAAAIAMRDGCDTLTVGAHDTSRFGRDIGIPELLEVDPASPYWITTSPSLWNRRSMLKLLGNRHGSAWEFEFTRPEAVPFALKQYLFDRRYIFFAPVWAYYAEFWAGTGPTPVLSDSALAKGKWQKGIPLFLDANGISGVAYWKRGFNAYPYPVVGGWRRKLAARCGIAFDLLLDILIRPQLRRKAVATLTERISRALRGETTKGTSA